MKDQIAKTTSLIKTFFILILSLQISCELINNLEEVCPEFDFSSQTEIGNS